MRAGFLPPQSDGRWWPADVPPESPTQSGRSVTRTCPETSDTLWPACPYSGPGSSPAREQSVSAEARALDGNSTGYSRQAGKTNWWGKEKDNGKKNIFPCLQWLALAAVMLLSLCCAKPPDSLSYQPHTVTSNKMAIGWNALEFPFKGASPYIYTAFLSALWGLQRWHVTLVGLKKMVQGDLNR